MTRVVGVVVPAHDEQALLPRTLASLRRAATHPDLRGIAVHVLSVLDACSDSTGEVAGDAIETNARNVGRARAAGFEHLLRRESGRPPEQIWLATTDADTVVPHDWLAVQLRLRRHGAAAVTGTVHVQDWTEQPVLVRATFSHTYGHPGSGHGHVHGANLGVSAAAYTAVGGMPPLALSEDQAFVDALRAKQLRIMATGAVPVLTSARRESRAAGGFAEHLRDLGRTPVSP